MPHIGVVRRCLEDELLGEVEAVEADRGQLLYPDGPERMADPALSGALLDPAIYPISFAHLALGEFAVQAKGTLAETGVAGGETIAIIGPSAPSARSSTMLAKTPCSTAISGTAARSKSAGWFYQPISVRLLGPDDREIDRYESPSREHGLAYEAAELARLLAQGKTESDLLRLDETLRIMRVLDEVRAELGVSYPNDTETPDTRGQPHPSTVPKM